MAKKSLLRRLQREIFVEYKNKVYSRYKEVIGYKLFYVGQELHCLNGEKVVLKNITPNGVFVEYKNKTYIRDRNIIGYKLFVVRNKSNPEITSNDEKQAPVYTCRDCMAYRRGECFGKAELCEYFFLRISEEEMANWPKYCIGAYDPYS